MKKAGSSRAASSAPSNASGPISIIDSDEDSNSEDEEEEDEEGYNTEAEQELLGKSC